MCFELKSPKVVTSVEKLHEMKQESEKELSITLQKYMYDTTLWYGKYDNSMRCCRSTIQYEE